MELGKQVWTEVHTASHLLIPLGSAEQHGPHLPIDTDAIIAEEIAKGAAAQTGATVAPTLAYGASGEHAGFAGTLSIGTEVLQSVVIELARSAALSFERVTFVNGHGGNQPAVSSAVEQLVAEGHRAAVWSPRIPGGDAHAGRTETSLMLAIAAHTVQLDRAESGNTEPLSDLIEDLRRGGVVSVSSNGVLGDPAGASAAEGEQILAALIADLAASV